MNMPGLRRSLPLARHAGDRSSAAAYAGPAARSVAALVQARAAGLAHRIPALQRFRTPAGAPPPAVGRRRNRGRGPAAPPPSCGIFDAPGLGPPRTQQGAQHAGPLQRALASALPALANAELLRRAAVALCMLCLIRVGHYIPVPGVDVSRALGAGADSLSHLLSGGLELPGNIFLLSITPLMTAYFGLALLQALPDTRRHFNKLREEGRAGRERVQVYISALFLASAVSQAWVESGRLLAATAAAAGGAAAAAFFRAQAGVTLMAGAVICKHAVQSVDSWGLGDGTGMVIGAGIALSYAQFLAAVVRQLLASPPAPAALAAALALCAALVAAVTWVQGVELRLPLTFYSPRRSQARAAHPVLTALSRGVDSGAALEAQSRLPLRLSPSGMRQLLFANFYVGILETPLRALGVTASPFANPWAFAALVFCVEAISLGDATPRQMADFLAQSDAGLQGLSPGVETEQFLAARRGQLKLLNAALVAGASLAARAVDAACAALTGAPFGCLNLLLLVSTVLSAARQADALRQGPRLDAAIAAEFGEVERMVEAQGEEEDKEDGNSEVERAQQQQSAGRQQEQQSSGAEAPA